ncbi:GHKL domain-containing protein [Bombilactobacillus bombi]|nr:GHKL domain-containing protein [Bombilactobacillus bombi]
MNLYLIFCVNLIIGSILIFGDDELININMLTDFIDNTLIIYLIANLTHIFNHNYKNYFFILDIIQSFILGYIGLYIENLNVLFWFLITFLLQKISHRLNYQFLNARLLSILTILFITIISACIEPIIRFSLLRLFYLRYSNDGIFYIRFILYIFISLSLILIIYKYTNPLIIIKQKIKMLGLEPKIFKILVFLLVSFIFIIFLTQITNITKTVRIPLLLIFLIFIALTFIQVFYFIQAYSYRQETEAKIVQNQQLQEYLQTMEQQYQELRHFKHDYQNMLLALEGFAKKGNQQQFRDYYQQLVQQQPQTENLKNLTISHIDYLKNEPLRGLIIQKFFAAQQANIQLQLEIEQDIQIHNSDILSIVRILGILLDNALEQTAQETEKVIQCSFNIIDKKVIEITVANPATNLTNIDQLFINGYTTKQGHHGFGLTNVQKLAKQNKNLFLETELLKQHLNITLMITGEE